VELIGHDSSTLTALFVASSAPLGQLPIARAAFELVKRYGFTINPKVEQLEATKVEFRQGAFNDVGIESFAIYNDGVVISSKSSTDVLDAFLQDLNEWMETTFSLRKVETHAINRAYESTLLVRSNAKLLQVLDALAPMQEFISKYLKAATGLEARLEPFGISFGADYSLIPGLKPINFRLERRGGLSFDTNYYISQAPLRTPDHLKLLDRLEKMARQG